jgi:eukaryotic-like serine/threonine-protein kinase
MTANRLGPWVIDEELGRGGMGCVYLAHREPAKEGSPERAAVKVLAAELATEVGFQDRFRREIDILSQLDHPHIVRFYESGVEAGRYWYAMEQVPGPSLEEVREKQGRLPWPEVLDVALQVAPALKHAHDRGIIHRDLKPSNLLRVESGEAAGTVKLTDFGIARLFASNHLTVTGAVVGTAEYLSPEQAAGKPVTKRSDLYSFGVVLYTLLAGRTPFEGEPLELLHKHRYAQFERPSRLVPGLPPDLEAVVCELLEKEPEKRPADAGVLYRRLDSLRRKEERKASHATAETTLHLGPVAGEVAGQEGPATLMSRLMREELERQNRGGPAKRLLNKPAVLVALFLLTAGLLTWAFWPASAEGLFRRGAALMASPDPADWERAWEDYFKPLESKYPDHPHKAEVEQFRRRLEDHQAGRQAEKAARRAGPMAEAQWFYQEGLRLRQRGDEAGARRVWKALVEAFGAVPSERPWVERARKELDAPEGQGAKRQLGPVREAVERARRLRAEGHADQADAILSWLRQLYQGDREAQVILGEK